MRALVRRTYGEVRGLGPDLFAGDIADEGFVNVATADEAVVWALDMGIYRLDCGVYTSYQRILSIVLVVSI
jgi:hypothetical protein